MNLRCTYCQTPFVVGRAEKLAALQHMQAENLHHYDAFCPHCRRANSVSRQWLEIFTPGWREGLSISPDEQEGYKRPSIPEKIRIEVWRRDDGKCVQCGSKERLEYDHIIPISKGGSNTARNIQLLCEKCNRSKGANIA